MDLALFMVGATIGMGAGLVFRRNNKILISTYYKSDLGVLGKKQHYEAQDEYQKDRDRDQANTVPYGNRHYKHPTKWSLNHHPTTYNLPHYPLHSPIHYFNNTFMNWIYNLCSCITPQFKLSVIDYLNSKELNRQVI